MFAHQPVPNQIIGTGMTADVYAWGTGRVLKLYHRCVADSVVDREYANTRAVKAIGLPVPQAYEMIETGGRRGIVFDRVEGRTIFEHVKVRPWTLFSAARQLAELHAQLHGCVAPRELPQQHHRIDSRIGAAAAASDEEKQIARRRLAELPVGESLCHGDFHPADAEKLCPRMAEQYHR
jgi:aminoglycoside phosphotransferase (APT) family kinase protein